MSAQYVRDYYAVPAKRGARIVLVLSQAGHQLVPAPPSHPPLPDPDGWGNCTRCRAPYDGAAFCLGCGVMRIRRSQSTPLHGFPVDWDEQVRTGTAGWQGP